jgi:hypothetical protein
MSATTLMSSLLVEHGRHLLETTRRTSQTGSDWAKASAAVSQSTTHFAEEIRGLTPAARFVTIRVAGAPKRPSVQTGARTVFGVRPSAAELASSSSSLSSWGESLGFESAMLHCDLGLAQESGIGL